MNSSVKAKQEELIASLDKFEAGLKSNLSKKLVDIENSIDSMQAELKAARSTQAAMKSELLTYKGQYTDLEKFIAAEEKRPKVCPQCNYPLQNLFKCCPMCGTVIPEAGDPDVDYLIPTGPSVNKGVSTPPPSPAAMGGTSNLPPSPVAGKSIPPSPAAGQVPPPPVGQKQFPNFNREADRGDAGQKQFPNFNREADRGDAGQKQFPNFNREADRGDAGASKQEEVDNAAGFLSRFGFGKKNTGKTSGGTSEPIQLGGQVPPPPPAPGANTPSGQAPVPPPPPRGNMPAKQFPNFARESDRGNTIQGGQPNRGGASVPPPPPGANISRGVSVPPSHGAIPPVPPVPPSGNIRRGVSVPPSHGAVPPVPPVPPMGGAVPPVPPMGGAVPPVPPKIVEPVEIVDASDITIETPGEVIDSTPKADVAATGEAIVSGMSDFTAMFKFHEVAEGYVIDKYIGSGNAKVNIPGNVEGKNVVAIGARAFLKNEDITEVVIADGVKLIGSECFFGCTALKSVVIAESVDKIKNAAFMDCTELSSVVLPKEMIDIGAYAFANDKSISAIEIPNGLKWISEFTMSKCAGLKKLVIPDGVRAVETSAFTECTSLEEIEMPMSLVSIGDKSFYNCRSLNRVVMPPSVTRFGTRVFFPKMGQNMIPKLTVYCSNGSAAYDFCKKNSIRSKADPNMPATAPTLKNAAYALELAYWMKDKDEEAINSMKSQTIQALEISEYEAEDFFVEEDGNCKELHALIPASMSVEDAESLCGKLPSSCYVQVIHAYDGKIDEAAKNAQSPF